MVGVDLCARGFPIWEQHVDALAMLRALFNLAASSRKDNISIHNVGQQARQAVLQIASTSTTLFMATLTFDILNPDSVEHRKVLMQLLALLIRKVRPDGCRVWMEGTQSAVTIRGRCCSTPAYHA